MPAATGFDISNDLALWSRSGRDLAELRDTYLYQATGYRVRRDGMGCLRVFWRGIVLENKFSTMTAAKKVIRTLKAGYRARAALVPA